MALPSETIVMLSKWMYDVYDYGALEDLQEKWFGFKDDDFTTYFPKEMSVASGLYQNKPLGHFKTKMGSGLVSPLILPIGSLIKQKKVGLI